jgi:TetR/AcrR family transcriptional regulator, fatty acid metabolism regulator protein
MKTKSEEKRLAILQAAFAVVTERGYSDTKVDEIARRAGVAKGTVYLYFRDKPAIYVGLVDWLLEQALAIIAEVRERPVSPRRKLEELFTTWASGMMSNPGVMALLSMENVNQTNTVMKRFKKHVLPHMLEMENAIAGIVKQGVEQGEFRPVEPRAAAMMYMSAFHAVLLLAARSPGARPGESVRELFFCGILADEKGRRPVGQRK